ncbi:MAG: hypothetical protein LBR64_06510 [Dysgonamonadaceae bacterium]|nr:hypothetical protein [Dysgonamonadaceae bacterium]
MNVKIIGKVAGYSLKLPSTSPCKSARILRCKPHPGQSRCRKYRLGQVNKCRLIHSMTPSIFF